MIDYIGLYTQKLGLYSCAKAQCQEDVEREREHTTSAVGTGE